MAALRVYWHFRRNGFDGRKLARTAAASLFALEERETLGLGGFALGGVGGVILLALFLAFELNAAQLCGCEFEPVVAVLAL